MRKKSSIPHSSFFLCALLSANGGTALPLRELLLEVELRMTIIHGGEFDSYWKSRAVQVEDDATDSAVREIIAAVLAEGDAAVRRFATRFDKSSPAKLEVPLEAAKDAAAELRCSDPELTAAMELAAEHIKQFSLKQKSQFSNFEFEMERGLFTGQRVIPLERAAIYVPAGRFPLFSTVLMGLIPAFCAGVEEVILASPPLENGLPDSNILAAAGMALDCCSTNQTFACNGKLRIFAMGGAQAIAALALGTEAVPRADFIAGPGNKFVAAAKKMLFGEAGIDFIAGPTDVLIITDGCSNKVADSVTDGSMQSAADLIAADMIAQAEHDPDARARALVPNRELAEQIAAAIEKQLASLSTVATARASLDSGGLIIIYQNMEEAVRLANKIAPEHLELQIDNADRWIPLFKNYGSLFIGSMSAEALGDYSAGINHTLPTSSNARYTGGLSVRNFLKTVTTLRCASGEGFEKARHAAQLLANAEGLAGHALSAAKRGGGK